MENMQNLAQSIPVKYRKIIYSILGTAFAIEAVFDGFGVGVIPERTQGIVLGVLAVLGFGIAVSNTGVSDV